MKKGEGPRTTSSQRSLLDTLYARAFQLSHDAVILSDLATGKIVAANEGIRISGWEPADLIGKTSAETGAIEDPAIRDAFIRELLEKRRVIGKTAFLRCRDGARKQVLLDLDLIEIDGASYVMTVFTDITQIREADRSRHRSEERYRLLFENMAEAIIVYDRHFILTDLNRSASEMIGYSREELIGRKVWELDIIHPDELPVAAANSTKLFAGELIPKTTYRFKHKNGAELIIDLTGRAIRDDTGAVIEIIAIAIDITESRRNLELLRHSEEKFRSVVEKSHIGIAIIDDDYTYRYVNDEFCRVCGYDSTEIIGKRIAFMIPEESRALILDRYRRRQSGQEVPSNYEITYLRKDGMPRVCELRSAVYRDSTGKVNTLIQALDITEIRAAQKTLRQNRDNLESLIENNDGPVWSVDREYRLIASNSFFRETARAICGVEARAGDLVIADRALGTAPDESRSLLEAIFSQWQAYYYRAFNGERFIIEGPLPSPFGERYMAYRFNPIRSAGGEVTGATIFGMDITERRHLEAQVQQAQKLESLGVLAGGIAHDFNNLLTAILGNIDLALIDIPHSSPTRESLLDAAQASHRAADLCRQMLAYSGKGRFQIEQLDINGVVAEMVHMLEISITKKAAIRYNLDPAIPAVMADATQVRQVIMNLVINASDAIGEQGGLITVATGAMRCDREYLDEMWTSERLPEGIYVYIEVADTGQGMDQETIRKIFDPFFSTKFTGRGLGLAAVMGIVRGHHGAVKVYSEPGSGSTFKVFLPAIEARDQRPADTAPQHRPWRGSGTVLLVDDEQPIIALGTKMLEHCGFEVLTAADGLEALAIFREQADRITCVILDLTMPNMDGEETFRELRRLRPETKVLMSSGYNELEVSRRFAGMGVQGFIQKPYRFEDFREKLREVLG